MIDRQQLLADLKPLLKELEADLRARCDEVPQIDADLKKEYEQARAADRTGVTYEEWRADLITQVAVAWVFSCVFVRFLEDNALIAPPRLSGPQGSGNLQRARDERETYFKTHAKQTDREYLLSVFDDLAKLPGTKDVFGPHNTALVPAYRNWLSGDAAQKLIEFFQKIDTDGTGEIIHDFTDPFRGSQGGGWDTRFLGDLYQDLSEAARKKYALLQTPIFVEEFILDRTLEPAINEFGLRMVQEKDKDGNDVLRPNFKMIDPACGSGHFLLGGFARLLQHWRHLEPSTSDRELILRALASVHGVDLNPFAIAITRFRLLVAVLRECRITKLKEAPAFRFNLVCGDSLLHGAPGTEQQLLGFHELAHHYQSEDIDELRRVLRPGIYHAVVANPPYITVKDKALNQAYRERYASCHRQYSLSVPFFERLFSLACDSGFTGQITANSFMKREFGKKLIETFLPHWDLTHVIDTQLAHIPEHGTATAILFGRHRAPISKVIRTVVGLRREDGEPDPAETGKVWTSILRQIDQPGSVSEFVSVTDMTRGSFHAHPWSIGGGGAAELKEALEADTTLGDAIETVCSLCLTRADEAYLSDRPSLVRRGLVAGHIIPMAHGEAVRDWAVHLDLFAVFPYGIDLAPVSPLVGADVMRALWPYREELWRRRELGGDHREMDRTWWEWNRFLDHRFRNPNSIGFAFVATHNHFVYDRGGKVFKQSAPVIKLPSGASEGEHLTLIGLLNSSTASFWMRQVFFCKGGGGNGRGISAEAWERMLEYDGTKLKRFPTPCGVTKNGKVNPLHTTVTALARDIDTFALARVRTLPTAVVFGFASALFQPADAPSEDTNTSTQGPRTPTQGQTTPTKATLDAAKARAEALLLKMIALQEELDWLVYRAYGLLNDSGAEVAEPPPIKLGERAFEIVMARKMEAGTLQTEWFRRHSSTPITQIPAHWPEAYKKVVEQRINLIETNKDIRLIEQPEYKRRWNTDAWEEMEEKALRGWLLGRLEACFDLDGRMNADKRPTAHTLLHQPRLTSVAMVADLARADKDFMQVAEVFAGRMDFDVGSLVGELIAAESVPALPVLRYKLASMDKRRAWERTWDLQRLEDAVDTLFDVERLNKIAAGKAEESLRRFVAAMRIDEQAKPQVLREAVGTAGYVAEAVKQKLDVTSDAILKPVHDAAKRAKQAAVGDIPVPPKYTSADFLSGDVWRLRGKLDVPKERWVSFPHCEGEDGTLVIAWAGYDHLQLARAIAERYELAKEQEGRKLVPLLAAIGELIPWLKQWHNEPDMAFGGTRMGNYFEEHLAQESKALGMSVEQVMAWAPPQKAKKAGRRKVPVGAGGFPDNDRDVLLITAALSLIGPNGISEDLHLDALILMTTPERCRALLSDTHTFDSIIKAIDSEFWTDISAKWKQTRDLLRQAKAIDVDPHSGHMVRKEPVFTKLHAQYGASLDALARVALEAARSIQNATSTIQKEQQVARKREQHAA